MEQFAGKSEVRTVAEETRSGPEQEPLRAQLESLDAALGFLLLLIASPFHSPVCSLDNGVFVPVIYCAHLILIRQPSYISVAVLHTFFCDLK